MDSGLFQDTFTFDNDMESFLCDDYSASQNLSPSTEVIFESPISSPAHEEGFTASETNTWLIDQGVPSSAPYPMDIKPEMTEFTLPASHEIAPSVSLLVPGNPYLLSENAFTQPQPFASSAEMPVSSPETTPSSEDDSEEDRRSSKRPQKKRKLTTTASVATKSRGSKKEKEKEREKEKEITLEFSDDRPLGLSREDLLTHTSAQFESYVRALTEKRELTSSEKSELKRQRRLIKNRESAQASRQRKKLNMEQLESRVQELENEKQALKEQMAALASKNSQLESELMYYRKSVGSNYINDLVSRGLNLVNTLGKPTLLTPTNGQSNIPAASLVVMVVLFSFGLLFPAFLGKALPMPLRETIPIVSPGHGRVFTTEGNYKQVSQEKELADIIEEQALPLRRLARALREETAQVEEVIDDPMSIDDTPSRSVLPLSEKIVLDVDVTSRKTTIPVADVRPSQVTISDVPQMLHFKPNTTYLLCQNVTQILPPTSSGVQNSGSSMSQEELHSNVPPQIAFIIPPDSFGAPAGNSGAKPEDKPDRKSMWNYSDSPSPYFVLDVHASPHSPSEKSTFLEVTCSVVDMNFIPINPPSHRQGSSPLFGPEGSTNN